MNKATIEKIAKGGSTKAPKTAQGAVGGEMVHLSPESVSALSRAIVDGIRDELRTLLPVIARIGAADTVHSVEMPATILKRAIEHGRKAAQLLEEASR